MNKTFLLINILLLLASCKNQPAEPKAAPATGDNTVVLNSEQYKNAGIATGKLQTKTLSSVLKLNGKIDVPPQNMVSVSVPLGGYLQSTGLLPGMHVGKGDVLAVMQDPQYIQLQQDYLTAKARFAFDESEYSRQRELNASKASSDKTFEQTQADYRIQKILVKSLEQKLRLIGLNPDKVTPDNISRSINIYSPITGFVSAVNANIGKYVTPSDVLFELVNPDDIHLALTVFDKDVNRLSAGQQVMAYSNENPNKKYRCRIILISKNLSGENTAQVHCHFEEYDKSLLPGMYMNADVETSRGAALALPEDAVVRFENKQYVFTAESGNRFEMQEVQTGNSENGYIEILHPGALANQSVVIKGAYTLLMALKNVGDDE